MKENDSVRCQELTDLCRDIRTLAAGKQYDRCREMICAAMGVYPCAPQPHNLMGVLYEMTGRHAEAMRQFRAASVLDPTYYPARQNLNTYGTFCSGGRAAYDESDCQEKQDKSMEIQYNSQGVGYALRRKFL